MPEDKTPSAPAPETPAPKPAELKEGEYVELVRGANVRCGSERWPHGALVKLTAARLEVAAKLPPGTVRVVKADRVKEVKAAGQYVVIE